MTVIMWTLRTGANVQGQEGAEQGERGRNMAKTQRSMRETGGSKRLKEEMEDPKRKQVAVSLHLSHHLALTKAGPE